MNELRPTTAAVDTSAFLRNLDLAKRLSGPGVEVMAVLKADGYGHGAVPLALAAEKSGVPFIGVATVEEALGLRRAGAGAGILVLGGVPEGGEAAALENNLAAVVFDLGAAGRLDRAAAAAGGKFPVHLKIDTGMGRLGFLPDDMERAAARIAALRNLEVAGIMTHYARAEEIDAGPTLRQAALFDEALAKVRRAGLSPRWVHARNSAAIILDRGPRYNLVRPGIMLYGSLPPGMPREPEDYGLVPPLSLKTAVVQLRRVPDGWPISYGGRYIARGGRLIGVLPVGYADGFLRYNSGGEVLVRGMRAPVVGTVCMDYAMVDLTGVPGAAAGDEAVVIGRQGDDSISAGEVAARGGTISYEVFCGLTARVPRVHGNS